MHNKLHSSMPAVASSVLQELLAGLRAESANEALPATANGLLDWGRYYLPQHFRRPPSKMHLWLAEQLDAMRFTHGMKLNVLGPRGGAKSTVGTLAFVLRAAVQGAERYIWIVSDTRHQAAGHLANIRAELLDNPQLAIDYPDAVGQGPVWRNGAITLNNGVTIEAYGTGQRIRGRRHRANRPTLIVCDDLQNDSHMESSAAREKSRRWFHGLLMKAGTHRTNVLNLANALHREALALELRSNPGWLSQRFQAIVRWPDAMHLWSEWEAIYTDAQRPNSSAAAREFFGLHRAAMEAGCELLWPEEEDLYTLMCMRVEGGRTTFEREKQNVPVNPDLCEWPEEYFGDDIWFEQWPQQSVARVIALDPSKGNDARHGDYSAYVMLAVDASGVLYIEADLARRPTPQIVADGVELCRRFTPQVFGMEVNQFQQLLADDFAAELARQGVLSLPVVPIENHVAKQVRIRRVGPYLSSRRIRFLARSHSTRLLVDQLRDFPLGAHDDGPDALEMAIRMAGDLLSAGRYNDGLGNRLKVGY